MLFGKKALRPGESVLIVGIGGGVAVACLQLAKLTGARVFVTSSSDAKIERAIALGASGGVNYRKDRVSNAILQMSNGGVDMVIDSVGEASWGESLRSLRRGGRLVTCGATTGSNPPADLQRVFIRQLEIYGSTGGSLSEFRQLLDVFNRGLVKPVVDATFAMADIRSAFELLDGVSRLAVGARQDLTDRHPPYHLMVACAYLDVAKRRIGLEARQRRPHVIHLGRIGFLDRGSDELDGGVLVGPGVGRQFAIVLLLVGLHEGLGRRAWKAGNEADVLIDAQHRVALGGQRLRDHEGIAQHHLVPLEEAELLL